MIAHTAACEATHVRNEQSVELLDRRVACFDRHLEEFSALVSLLSRADETVIERSVTAAQQLSSLDSCRSSASRFDVDPPPPASADAVAELRGHLARVRAFSAAAQYEEGSRFGCDRARRCSAT